MAVKIGSSIAALQAQRRLSEATSSVSVSLARLSSGQRITRASDDAAGVAIADTLKNRARVYTRGAKNVGDGLSLLDVADATVTELSGLATRILELAEQAATGGYSSSQRRAMDTEAQRLRDEFWRISRATQFNGLNLFDGSVQSLRIQSGFGVEGGITSSLGGNLGTGELGGAAAVTSTGVGAYALASADFNGDGTIDIVTSNSTGNQLKFLRGNGNGTFAAPVDLVAGSTTVDIAAADFNNDGAMDIIAASGTTSLSLFLNNRAGGFNAVSTVTTSGNAIAVTAADTDNDGRMDIVVANNNAGNDTISVLRGSGTGTFAAASDFSLGIGFNPYLMAQGDFNGDGNIDIATNGTSLGLQILQGNGSGGFGAASVAIPEYFESVAIGDFNGDGLADLAGVNSVSNTNVSIFLRSSNGNAFSSEAGFGTSTPDQLFTLAAGDLNGDGSLDILAADSFGLTYSLLGDNRGALTEQFSTTFGPVTYTETTLVDINGDGVPDFVGVGGAVAGDLNTSRNGINPLLPFSLRTQADAAQAIAPLSRKLDDLNKQRGVIGSFQSRLTTAGQSATTQSDGFKIAESRIRDVDVAMEMAKLTSAQIRQQAATAVLAQANVQPSLALQLLRA